MSCKAPIDRDRLIDLMYEKIVAIDEAIRGNGKPGINVRLDRVEGKVSAVSKLTWLLIGALIVALVKQYIP